MHVEKAVKAQLLYNAAVDLGNGQDKQFHLLLDMPGCSAFINKPRTETKSSQILGELGHVKDKELVAEAGHKLESIKETLEERKKEVLSEFNLSIPESLSVSPKMT